MTYLSLNEQSSRNSMIFSFVKNLFYYIDYLFFYFLGVFYVNLSDTSTLIYLLIRDYITKLCTKDFVDVFSRYFGVNLIIVLVVLMFSLTLFGTYLLRVCFSFLSFLLGVTMASFYKNGGFTGFLQAVRYLFPFCLILIFIGIYVFEKSGEFSSAIFKKVRGESSNLHLKSFVVKMCLAVVILVLLSLFNAVIIKSL